MNTIILDEKETSQKFFDYKGERWFENFIFDEFRIIWKQKDFRVVYKVKKEGEIWKVNQLLNKHGSCYEANYSFAEDEEDIHFIDNPNGELVKYYVEKLDRGILPDDELVKSVLKIFACECTLMSKIKQYIMNESYKRAVVRKESAKRERRESTTTKKSSTTRVLTNKYLLNDIIEYVGGSDRHMKINCECWGVRGHFRHYKSGKVVWIDAYEKGSKRNTGVLLKGNIYVM